MTTGQRIKDARKRAGLTQKELGERLGIAYQTLAQWENDLRKPKHETLQRIADALDVAIIDLDERFAYQPKREITIVDEEEDAEREKAQQLCYSLGTVGLKKVQVYIEDLMHNPENRPHQN